MDAKLFLVSGLLVGMLAAVAAPAAAHIQVGRDSWVACAAVPSPSHVHVPGDATDNCTPPAVLLFSLEDDLFLATSAPL